MFIHTILHHSYLLQLPTYIATENLYLQNIQLLIANVNGSGMLRLKVGCMGATTVSSSLGSGTGVFGNNDNRIYAENPGAADNGWTLTLNVATPGTGVWSAGGGKQYKYNGTTNEGVLRIDPSGGTVTPVIGAAAGITKGTSTSFSGTSPVTLMSASATASKVWAGYITNTSLAQTIPAGQAAGTYVLPMVQTITAL